MKCQIHSLFAFAVLVTASRADTIYVTGPNKLLKLDSNGSASTVATVPAGGGIAISPAGDIYVDEYNTGTISKVTPSGVVSTFASGVNPYGLAFDPLGNLYVANYGSNSISKVTPSGSISTFAAITSPVGLAFDTT